MTKPVKLRFSFTAHTCNSVFVGHIGGFSEPPAYLDVQALGLYFAKAPKHSFLVGGAI